MLRRFSRAFTREPSSDSKTADRTRRVMARLSVCLCTQAGSAHGAARSSDPSGRSRDPPRGPDGVRGPACPVAANGGHSEANPDPGAPVWNALPAGEPLVGGAHHVERWGRFQRVLCGSARMRGCSGKPVYYSGLLKLAGPDRARWKTLGISFGWAAALAPVRPFRGTSQNVPDWAALRSIDQAAFS